MGDTLTQTAHKLGIAGTTARTHLVAIFSETGVSRQTDLIALIGHLMPPLHRPKQD
jgi:DNA-binding CsgD family transcriptional regulator